MNSNNFSALSLREPAFFLWDVMIQVDVLIHSDILTLSQPSLALKPYQFLLKGQAIITNIIGLSISLASRVPDEEFKDSKRVIRIRNQKKNRQHKVGHSRNSSYVLISIQIYVFIIGYGFGLVIFHMINKLTSVILVMPIKEESGS